jgi:crotonobetainyl-CoA:carnitine CoA-transferase CaiB-like acyl-CoA transferase
MPGPLEGINVVDFTIFINGPSATGQMCEQGATVLKVEPKSGDAMRLAAGGTGVYSAGFELYNRGKLSMTLDMKHPKAKDIMKRLVKWADVLTENFKPGTMDRLGFGYEICKEWNPMLLYCSNSGFGPTGEWSTRPSYDGMAQAITGVLSANAGGISHPPRPIGWTFSDVVGGNMFYSAILAALVARGRTGKGQQVLCSQTGATLYFQRSGVSQTLDLFGGEQPDSGMHAWERFCFQQTHRALDGKGLCVSMTKLDQLKRFCCAIGKEDLLIDKVTKRWPVPPAEQRDWMLKEVGDVIAKKPLQYWIDICVHNNVPCAPISGYADLADKSNSVGRHMYDNEYIIDVNHRDYGKLNWVGVPTRFSGTPNKHKPSNEHESWHAPWIGEHSLTALVNILGYTKEEANTLMKSQVVPDPTGPRAIQTSRNARDKYAAKMKKRKEKFENKRSKL